jgi:hypothetical protein
VNTSPLESAKLNVGEHFADRELAADVGHGAVVADIQLGRFERRIEYQDGVAAVHFGAAGAVDAGLERVADTAEVPGIVGQRFDVVLALGARHARQVHVLDHFQAQLEQFHAQAETVQAEVGRLQQHHQVLRRQGLEQGQHLFRRDTVEVDEVRVRQVAAVGGEQGTRQAGAGVVHHQGAPSGTVFEGDRQHVAQVGGGAVDGGCGQVGGGGRGGGHGEGG